MVDFRVLQELWFFNHCVFEHTEALEKIFREVWRHKYIETLHIENLQIDHQNAMHHDIQTKQKSMWINLCQVIYACPLKELHLGIAIHEKSRLEIGFD